MTFSEYIIRERSKGFYIINLGDIIKNKTTLEEWFSDMYIEYKILYLDRSIT